MERIPSHPTAPASGRSGRGHNRRRWLQFPNCPRATIYDGSEHDYRVLVPVDAVSAIEAWHISELAKIGVLTTGTADLLRALSSAASVGRSRAWTGLTACSPIHAFGPKTPWSQEGVAWSFGPSSRDGVCATIFTRTT